MSDKNQAGITLTADQTDKFIKSMDESSRALNRFVDQTESSETRVAAKTGIIAGAFVSMATTVIDMAAQAAQAVSGFVADSIGVAADFQANTLNFEAVAGELPVGKLEEFKQMWLDLGAATKFSAADAQQATIELVKGGVDIAKVQSDATAAVLDLAGATDMELAPAAEIVATNLAVWSRHGITATNVVDLLSQAANASSLDVDDLALGIANSAGQAEGAGVEFDDLIKTIALIRPQFAGGSDAGTGFKTFLQRLTPQSKEATKAMMALGLATEDGKSAFFDANGQFVGMEQTAQMLQTALAGLSDEQKNATLTTIFGSDAARAAIALANAGAAGYNDMAAAMSKVGSAADQAGKKQQGLAFAQEQFAGSIETLQIVLGTLLLPILTDLFNNVLTPGVNAIMSIVQSFQAASGEGKGFGETLMTMFPVLEQFAPVFEAARAIVEQVMWAMSTYIQAAVAQIQIFLSEHGDEIQAIFQEVWKTIGMVVETAIAIITNVVVPGIARIASFINENSETIQAIWTAVWTVISTVVKVAIGIIQTVLKVVMSLITGQLDTDLVNILELFEKIWQDIQTAVRDTLNSIIRTINNKVTEIANALRTGLTNAYNAAVQTLTDWIKIGEGIIDSIVTGLRNAAELLVNTLRNAILSAFNAALSIFPGPIQEALRSFLGIPATTTMSGFAGSSTTSNVSNFSTAYNLNVTSMQSTGTVTTDFNLMRALASP
jgi:TP901 family phage tail tape measure protein